MKLMYKVTLAMSCDSSPTAGLIIPLHKKLMQEFSSNETDSPFLKKLKAAVHENLEKRYQKEDLVRFLEEATCFDPRVKDAAPEEMQPNQDTTTSKPIRE